MLQYNGVKALHWKESSTTEQIANRANEYLDVLYAYVLGMQFPDADWTDKEPIFNKVAYDMFDCV